MGDTADALTNVNGQPQKVLLVDVNGNKYSLSNLLPIASSRVAATILTLPSLARAAYSSGLLTVGQYVELAFDITVTALTGGASPTVTFKVGRQGADSILYNLYNPTALSAAGSFTTSFGSGLTTNNSFGSQIQIDMVVTGAPTSITFSGSLIGK
jgi:hypothetical protein